MYANMEGDVVVFQKILLFCPAPYDEDNIGVEDLSPLGDAWTLPSYRQTTTPWIMSPQWGHWGAGGEHDEATQKKMVQELRQMEAEDAWSVCYPDHDAKKAPRSRNDNVGTNQVKKRHLLGGWFYHIYHGTIRAGSWV
jgi:hypothetical protein